MDSLFSYMCAHQRDISENTKDWNLSCIYEMEDIFTYGTSDTRYNI